MSQLFASGGQSDEASAAVCPVNIQGWFPLGLTGLICLQSKRLSRLLQHHSLKASILPHSFLSNTHLWFLYVFLVLIVHFFLALNHNVPQFIDSFTHFQIIVANTIMKTLSII